jgi:stearoyl-CoA desaturase (Delta-9 desaturase)
MDILIYTLICSHLVVVGLSVWAHRGVTHRALEFNVWLEHVFRFWMWFSNAFPTKVWVAVHRQHHAFSDEARDPHSPKVFGFWRVMLSTPVLIMGAAKADPAMIESLGRDTPDDWVEQKVYSRYPFLGLGIFLLLNCLLFGWWGILVTFIVGIVTPVLGAGTLNSVGHSADYQNKDPHDTSKNFMPLGVVLCGEEFHRNHHDNPASAKLSKHWYEFDLGWLYISILKRLNLVTVRQ